MVVMAVIIAGVSVFLYLACEETAEAGPSLADARQARLEALQAKSKARWDEIEKERREHEALWKKREAEMDRNRAEREKIARQRPKKQKRTRRVKRYTWEAPAETRARLWNVPETEAKAATTIGLFRICMSEQAGSENDCIGIWQVLNNIRSRSCNRGLFRKITECDENGETMLSVMKRASRFVLGVVPARNKRQVWIRELELSCERPASFLLPGNIWKRHLYKRCQRTAEIARRLTGGERLSVTKARVIAWGGRCETSQGACDDRHACERGLARVQGTQTHNAFWCMPGSSPGCPTSFDPVCEKLGYKAPRVRASVVTNLYEDSEEANPQGG
jgi:hypothetical protein